MVHHLRPLKHSGYPCACPHVAGFILIEAVIAVFVPRFGLAAVAPLQADLLIGSEQTKSLAEATVLARS